MQADSSTGRVIEGADRGAVDFFSKEDDLSMLIQSVRFGRGVPGRLPLASRWARSISCIQLPSSCRLLAVASPDGGARVALFDADAKHPITKT